MARSRNIKPGFFKNEYLAVLSPHARLLFIGLWCLADVKGRLEDRPLKIKAELFPYESVDLDSLLNELAYSPGKFLIRYSVDENRYIEILNFRTHQNPHKNEKAAGSKIPPLPEKDGTSTVPVPYLYPTSPADSFNLIPDSLYGDEFKNSSEQVNISNKEETQQCLILQDPPKEKQVKTGKFSAEVKELVQEFQNLLKNHGVTTFGRDWHLTGYSSCEALLKQGKAPEEIRQVFKWAVETWACRNTVTHFKHIHKAYSHWELEKTKTAIAPKMDTSARDALLAFPFIKHRFTEDPPIPASEVEVKSEDPHNIYYGHTPFPVWMMEGVQEETSHVS